MNPAPPVMRMVIVEDNREWIIDSGFQGKESLRDAGVVEAGEDADAADEGAVLKDIEEGHGAEGAEAADDVHRRVVDAAVVGNVERGAAGEKAVPGIQGIVARPGVIGVFNERG